MDLKEKALELHKKYRGKLEVRSLMPIKNREDLSLAYTPGVAFACMEIANDKNKVYDYTFKGRMVAVVTDGTAVLGLGNIGPEASLPVMEGKCQLFKEFGGVDAFPIALTTQDTEEIISTVKKISPVFGGINLEDISAPRCFEIEKRLIDELDIPVFHDDQHGTAIVVLAGLTNALKLVNPVRSRTQTEASATSNGAGKNIHEIKIVISGAGAAGIAVTKILLAAGVKNIILLDTRGAIWEGRAEGMNWAKDEIAKVTNREKIKGGLAEAIRGADVFIGLSQPGLLTKEMVQTMASDPIIFAMANPTPEIMPEIAKEAGAWLIATGRSDYNNQINNVLAFPGLFRGVLGAGVKKITMEMKIAAAHALADYVKNPTPDYFIPRPFDEGVADAVAKAVVDAASSP